MRKQRECNGWFVEFYEIFSGIFEQYAQFNNKNPANTLTFKYFIMLTSAVLVLFHIHENRLFCRIYLMTRGEEKAWEILEGLNPDDVCLRTKAAYENGDYILNSFGLNFLISPDERHIKSTDSCGESILKKSGYFFNISALHYLVHAKNTPLSGKLLKPDNVKGGDIFFMGTHQLPLNEFAKKYGTDKTGFIQKSKSLNGKNVNYGDVSIELLPMPRIPATLILWLADTEFPSRADLLFDTSVEQHLQLDIIWSIAMSSILVML